MLVSHLFRGILEGGGDTEGDGGGGGAEGEALVSRLPATPHYNSAILEDMCMKDHLAALHGMCGDSEAFRDAIILGKVWWWGLARCLARGVVVHVMVLMYCAILHILS